MVDVENLIVQSDDLVFELLDAVPVREGEFVDFVVSHREHLLDFVVLYLSGFSGCHLVIGEVVKSYHLFLIQRLLDQIDLFGFDHVGLKFLLV
jgi:hypothetical protein